MHCNEAQYTLRRYTTLHYTTLHYTTLHYTTLHYTALHYTTLHYTTLHYTTLHYTTLHYTTLHYTTLHYTTLRYATPHLTSPTSGAVRGPEGGLELGRSDAGAHLAAAQVRNKARAHAHTPARFAMPVSKTSRPLPSGNSAFGIPHHTTLHYTTPHLTSPHHTTPHHTPPLWEVRENDYPNQMVNVNVFNSPTAWQGSAVQCSAARCSAV